MSYLSKDAYEAKREWAAKRMLENSKIEAHNFASRVNDTIEEYLQGVDTKHGTNYCPSGTLRIF